MKSASSYIAKYTARTRLDMNASVEIGQNHCSHPSQQPLKNNNLKKIKYIAAQRYLNIYNDIIYYNEDVYGEDGTGSPPDDK